MTTKPLPPHHSPLNWFATLYPQYINCTATYTLGTTHKNSISQYLFYEQFDLVLSSLHTHSDTPGGETGDEGGKLSQLWLKLPIAQEALQMAGTLSSAASTEKIMCRMVWVGRTLRSSSSTLLPWTGTPSTRLGCPKPHPTWPWGIHYSTASFSVTANLNICFNSQVHCTWTRKLTAKTVSLHTLQEHRRKERRKRKSMFLEIPKP